MILCRIILDIYNVIVNGIVFLNFNFGLFIAKCIFVICIIYFNEPPLEIKEGKNIY